MCVCVWCLAQPLTHTSHTHTHSHPTKQNKKQKNKNKKPKTKNSASELRSLLGGLGPSFVKIGQALSARPDLLPAPYLRALSDLQVGRVERVGFVGGFVGRGVFRVAKRAAAAADDPLSPSPPPLQHTHKKTKNK